LSESLFPEDAAFISRIKSRIGGLKGKTLLSDFLFPWEISLIMHVVLDTELQVDEWGGMENAFRKRVVGSTRKIKRSMFRIEIVEFKPQSRIVYHNRKSVLNAFYNQGINAELIGDIMQVDDSWFAAIDKSASDIEFSDAELLHDVDLPSDAVRKSQPEISGTTASVRLDSICSIAFKPSRGKLKGLIANGGAMVDYRFVNKGSREVNEGSVISLRGFPRFCLVEIGAVTKKGRARVRVDVLDR
jgi:RNA-binding protein YlmH